VPVEASALTRKEFLAALAAPVLLPEAAPAREGSRRLLIVVAHPDDEYAFAGATYRLVRESGWSAEQVVITDGEGGYRYSTLAEKIYGQPLASPEDGRKHLVAIRREETLRAGKILGVEHYRFLDQKDHGFAGDPATADTSDWDRPRILRTLHELLAEGRYDAVFTYLPTPETHAHHRAATELALQAIAALPAKDRPVCLGVDTRARTDTPRRFAGSAPSLVFDRSARFGYHDALNYQIVVNWVIAEHKSQGLFQMDCGKHDFEEFWILEPGGEREANVVGDLRMHLRPPDHTAATQ